MHTQHLIDLDDQHGARLYQPLDVLLVRGEGVWLYDADGRRYLDFLAAYSAVNQGHCHPRILAACEAQARTLTLTSRAFRNDRLPRLYEMLHALTGFDKVLLMSSGAEAVESAIKLARRWGYDVKGIPPDGATIIVCRHNFHGRTTTVISGSTEDAYRRGFGPLTPGFRVIPFGDADALREAITPDTCAFLVEPIQGEAGVIVPPAGYLTAVREICTQQQVLWMADEIQSGLGRAGALFACQHDEVVPDVLILGKALGGGFYPVSAVLASAAVMDVLKPGDHGSTFGGNPLACAIAQASLQVIVDERLPERSAELGAYLLDRVRALATGNPLIREVRGRGLWIGLELTEPARPYCEALARLGVLCKETHSTTIRLAPPLVITRDEIDWALERLAAVLQGAAVSRPSVMPMPTASPLRA
jgi:ornithine--oxo-acid transaminase